MGQWALWMIELAAVCQNRINTYTLISIQVRSNHMENFVRYFSLNAAKIDSRHLRLILVVITLILFVIGAGAPFEPEGS
jgi:hypothetical protein